MIFTKLKLNNFKSHQNTTIEFKKGISVIVGENGAGKSTILDAIGFALFKQHTVELDDLVRNNANTMSVELEFIAHDKQYKIVREKKSDLLSSMYTKTSADGGFVKICSGDDEVNEVISQILDIDSDLFLNAIYIRQGEISELLDKTPDEKKVLISKLLGIDSLEKAWENLQPFINDYENDLSELKGKLYNSKELKEEHEQKMIELNALKDRGHELEEQIEDVTDSLKEIAESKRDMETEKEIYESLVRNLENEKNNLTKLETDKRSLQEDLDKIRHSEEQISRLEKYVSKLDVYLDFEKSVINIQNLKGEEKRINEKLDSINQQKAIINDKKEEYNKFLASDEEIAKLNDQKVQYEKQLATMAKLEQDKKDLLRSIEDERNDIENFYSQAKDILADKGLDEDDLNQIDGFTSLEKTTNEFIDVISQKVDDLSKNIIDKNEDVAIFKQNIKSTQKSLDELEGVDNKCPICQSDLDSKKKLQLIQQYEREISDNKKLISQNEGDIRLFTKNKENFEDKLSIINDLSKGIIEYKQKFEHLEKELVKLNKLDEDLESKESISNKLGEIILLIAKKRTDREDYQASYESYNQAKGALDILGDQTEVQYELKKVKNEIDNHVKNIKLAIDQDPHLSADISPSELQNRITDLKQKNEEYNQCKGFIQNKNALMTQHDTIKEEIGASINQIDITQNKIEATLYDEEEYEQILYRYERYERQQNAFKNELSEIKGRARESINYLKELNEKIVMSDKFQQEFNNVKDYINLLNHIGDLYDKNGIQKDLRNISRPLIQEYTKEFFDEFNFNYSDLTLDEDYEVTLYGPEGESSMSMVSGGEKIAIALALRLGITQALSNGELDTILLDEPTIHLDSSRRHELVNLLNDMSLLPQMIIVTHDSQLENVADNLIKVEKENGISKVMI